MKAPKPRVTFEAPFQPHIGPDGRISSNARRELRHHIAQINDDLDKIGRQHRIGRLWRLERNHHFGIMAIFAMVDVTQGTVH